MIDIFELNKYNQFENTYKIFKTTFNFSYMGSSQDNVVLLNPINYTFYKSIGTCRCVCTYLHVDSFI